MPFGARIVGKAVVHRQPERVLREVAGPPIRVVQQRPETVGDDEDRRRRGYRCGDSGTHPADEPVPGQIVGRAIPTPIHDARSVPWAIPDRGPAADDSRRRPSVSVRAPAGSQAGYWGRRARQHVDLLAGSKWQVDGPGRPDVVLSVGWWVAEATAAALPDVPHVVDAGEVQFPVTARRGLAGAHTRCAAGRRVRRRLRSRACGVLTRRGADDRITGRGGAPRNLPRPAILRRCRTASTGGGRRCGGRASWPGVRRRPGG